MLVWQQIKPPRRITVSIVRWVAALWNGWQKMQPVTSEERIWRNALREHLNGPLPDDVRELVKTALRESYAKEGRPLPTDLR
jgi:hypothetical protein